MGFQPWMFKGVLWTKKTNNSSLSWSTWKKNRGMPKASKSSTWKKGDFWCLFFPFTSNMLVVFVFFCQGATFWWNKQDLDVFLPVKKKHTRMWHLTIVSALFRWKYEMQDLDFSSAEAFPSLAGAYKNTTLLILLMTLQSVLVPDCDILNQQAASKSYQIIDSLEKKLDKLPIHCSSSFGSSILRESHDISQILDLLQEWRLWWLKWFKSCVLGCSIAVTNRICVDMKFVANVNFN